METKLQVTLKCLCCQLMIVLLKKLTIFIIFMIAFYALTSFSTGNTLISFSSILYMYGSVNFLL